jgi:hypothetical protein
MIMTFEEISVKATKRWIDNGRRRQKTKTFSQMECVPEISLLVWEEL